MAEQPAQSNNHISNIDDLQREGSRRLPKAYRDYYNEGAMDLITLHDNVAAYDKFHIRPNHLRKAFTIDTSTTIFGQKIDMPIGFSPSAMHKLAHPDGEAATSRAAATYNIPMALSSYSNVALEEVKLQGNDNPYIMHLCMVKDRSIPLQLIKRAKAAGYKALFVSVDTPCLGRRLNEMRNNFTLPPDLQFPNNLSAGSDEFADNQETRENGPQAFDDTLEWDEVVPWLKSHAGDMQLWLKGITSPEDVELAIKHKVHGVVISNHGGRQLDSMPSTVDALIECAAVAQGRIHIAVDGGIRRGSDVFKALALGAKYVFLGRVVVWGLAYAGQSGVEIGLEILQQQLRDTMEIAGCRKISDISRDHLRVLGQNNLLAKL